MSVLPKTIACCRALTSLGAESLSALSCFCSSHSVELRSRESSCPARSDYTDTHRNSIKSSAGLTVQDTGANPAQLQYIALSFGMSLAVNAWVFFRISGGLFNPAVTVGMCLIGALPWVRGILLFFVQILGGITAAAIVSCLFPGPLLCTTTLGGGTSIAQGVFIEVRCLAWPVSRASVNCIRCFSRPPSSLQSSCWPPKNTRGHSLRPVCLLGLSVPQSLILSVGIGLSLFVAEMTGVYFTGGSLNPARSFGPAVVLHQFDGESVIVTSDPC